MTWVAQSLLSLDLTELSQRINERRNPASLVERMYTGVATIPIEDSVDLFGNVAGIYDSLMSMVTYLAVFPANSRVHIFAAGVTVSNQPAVLEAGGVYLIQPARLFHVILANPSETESIEVQYFIGGDAPE